jgi:nucleotide-binding universal stress UspA family protein
LNPPVGLQLQHVLVPLDGSERALQALPTARALATRLGAQVQTITVAGDDKDAARLRTFAAAVLGVEADDETVTVVVERDPAEAIVHRAEELGSCVVCLSTAGRGRLSGALVGSVARSVLQRSADPVVALGPMADNPGWTPRPRSWPEPLSIPRIVACVDGSATSEAVLPITAAWAAALGMSMTILTVIDESLGSDADASAYVARLVQQWGTSPTKVDGAVVRDPISPANGIRIHLDERPAGLVALTTHSRAGLQRVRLGAAAASIVRASVAPCLVAPVQT